MKSRGIGSKTGVAVAVTIFGGVAVGVPVVKAMAVASKLKVWAVASFAGVGMGVTTMGVTQLAGGGVGVPNSWT